MAMYLSRGEDNCLREVSTSHICQADLSLRILAREISEERQRRGCKKFAYQTLPGGLQSRTGFSQAFFVLSL